MNLIPIDAGGTPTELVGGDASPGGDFAALMTGLMTGDTQIVPLIDIPVGEQLSEGADGSAQDETSDVATSILEFIGSPPAGLTITPLRHAAQSGTSTDVQEAIDGVAVPAAPVLDGMAAGSEADASIDPADAQALATVHPIRTHVATTPPGSPETDSTAGTVATDLVGNESAGRQREAATSVSTAAAPEIAVVPGDRSARPAGDEAPGATPLPKIEPSVVASAAEQRATAPGGSQTSTPEPAGGDARLVESDVDIDTGTAARPLDTVRPGSSITQPAMVGIARRVEEAIAALATKPDPKIVTLQLDELNGLRLTVALRPDGIHLSSSGDATLTTEIERALASRGFEMATGGDRSRQGSEENTDDGWRPQPATPGRPARPNQSGIRL